MLTIWGRLSSINVQKVVWAAGEAGQAFERIDVGGPFGGLDTPEFLAMNPNRQIPVLRDGTLVLWESNSIVRYLVARHASGELWEEDPARRVLADRWMDWTNTSLQPALARLLWGVVRKLPGFTDPNVIAESLAQGEALMEILAAQLDDSPYLAGERFGMADIAVGCGAHRWLHMPIERIERPAVRRWYEAIHARPAARAALPLPVA
ncbi:glutathione S-transferase family protein [Bosea sp. (in: a-proteobacteria)]|uniref:glutathione S-transferase family protein n=1 Tax=Bosea sp. (in: a-proteobacteria) TaxID=1871050 RepID=UPI00261D6093|nr:glutathione S-transferase family protein [Bosea sp. (in: a-proteobacteria)]MCO5093440.1 glutathione S-transferase family protein [Bosea sp. (in: a-proteobacteria)]